MVGTVGTISGRPPLFYIWLSGSMQGRKVKYETFLLLCCVEETQNTRIRLETENCRKMLHSGVPNTSPFLASDVTRGFRDLRDSIFIMIKLTSFRRCRKEDVG